MIENDNRAKHLENLSDHELVHLGITGQIPLKKYGKLFNEQHKSPDLLEMAFSKKELNKIYTEYPGLRPKDKNKSKRISLESIVDSLGDKKNQVIEKVVDFVKKLGK